MEGNSATRGGRDCPDSDFDGDGMIDLDDFFFFAGAFGGTDPLYDLNKSGKVDFEDFFIFAVPGFGFSGME